MYIYILNEFIYYIYIYIHIRCNFVLHCLVCTLYNGSIQDTRKTRVLKMMSSLYYSTGEIVMCFSEVKSLCDTLIFMR